MKISSKVRNGLAAIIYIAQKTENNNEKISLLTISSSLNISKIYLEQAFVLLKKENLVASTKGPKGGYTLSREASQITIYDILNALDNTIFEPTEKTISSDEVSIEKIMQQNIFSEIDDTLKAKLQSINLETLLEQLKKLDTDDYIYYL